MARSSLTVKRSFDPLKVMAAAGLLFLMALPVLAGTGLIAVPDLLPARHYLAFHNAVELFTVAVAILVFATGFHLLDKNRSTPSCLLACAFLGVGLLDFLHMLSYAGMPDFFTVNTPHKAIVLWLAARFLAAIALLIYTLAPAASPPEAFRRGLLLAASLAYVLVFGFLGVFHPERIPATFVPEHGLTPFKIWLEWLVIGLHLVTLAMIAGRRRHLPGQWVRFLVPAILLIIASELFLTFYSRVTDSIILLGHVYKVLAYLLIYLGMFIESVRLPYIRLEEAYHGVDLAKQELRSTSERLTALIEAIPDAIFFKDGAGRWRVINDAAKHLFKLHGFRWQGKTEMELAAARPEFRAVHEACREGDEKAWLARGLTLVEERVIDTGGRSREFEVRKVPLFEVDGSRKALVVIGRDVSAHKEAEKRLRESRQFLNSILESIQDGISVLDPDLTISHVNGVMEKWYQDRAPLVGRKCYQVYRKREKPCRACPALRCMATGAVDQQEVSGRAGSPMEHLELFCYPVKDPDTGKVIRVVKFVRDITARKQMEARMLQTGKMEALGVLAGGIAHDFNNILTPIVMHTELAMQESRPGSKVYQSLEQVEKAAERATSLVRQILDFSRQGSFEPRPLKLSLIIKDALKFLYAAIPPNIELRQDLNTDRDIVVADPVQMLQVVMNLAVNAAHAMREKGGRLTFVLAEAEADIILPQRGPDSQIPWLKLTVHDTGEGIPPANLEKIFDPFFTTKENGEGTGMGLAVVHGIVTRHGGSISVHSEPGAGAAFEILLPRAEADPTAALADDPPAAGGNERILLVDDEQPVVEAAAAVLARLGYHVTSTTSGAEALEVFRNHPDSYDLVITDNKMPEMTGTCLSLELRKIRPDIPVILGTGFNGTMDEAAARTAGIAAFVLKPFSLSELATTIRRVLEARNLMRTRDKLVAGGKTEAGFGPEVNTWGRPPQNPVFPGNE